MTSFERSVAFWLRAYPRRWREVRSAEVSAVLADLTEPGAERLGPLAAFELVRGGWATRWRGHPPLHVYLAYRCLGVRIPARWRGWAHDDIEGPLWSVRRGLGLSWLVWIGANIRPWWWTFSASLLLVAFAVAIQRHVRAREIRHHVALRAGEVVVPGALVEGLARRRRLEARSTLRASRVVLALAALGGVAGAWIRPPLLVHEPCGPGGSIFGCAAVEHATLTPARPFALAAMGIAVVVGLGLVPLVRSRLRELCGDLPSQPHRDLIITRPRDIALQLVATVVVVVAGLGLFASRALAVHTLAALTAVVGPFALLVLPGIAAIAHVLRASGPAADGLSMSDVRTMVLRGRTPKVDALQPGLVCVDELWARYAVTPTTEPESPGLENPTLGPA